jgi:CRP-like cAMP-binding protein
VCAFAPNTWLANSVAPSSAIYKIRSGWACEYRALPSGSKAIVDVYLPGDVIALDAVLRIRRLEAALTLTSVMADVIDAEHALTDLLASPSAALYITWLLGQRQRRADELLASLLCLDARGRVAKMLLDLHTRLSRKKMITGQTYDLPLTQAQIGSYVGLTVVHVNRVLRWLRDERIVQLEKHCVTILDFNQLKSLAQQEWFENSIEHSAPASPSDGLAIQGSM